MIRLIEDIYILDFHNDTDWKRIPIVPGTATISQQISPDDNKGSIEKVEISAVIEEYITQMTRDLLVYVVLDNHTTVSVGTEDLPATFELKRASNITATLKYERIPR